MKNYLVFAAVCLFSSLSAWGVPQVPERLSPEQSRRAWFDHHDSMMTESQVTTIIAHRIPQYNRFKSLKLAEHLFELSRQHDFDPAFILSVIDVESSFRPSAVSYAGAVGLMQIMPATGRWLAQKMRIPYSQRMLLDPFFNIQLGVHYLALLRDRYKSHFDRMLAAYNAGPGVVDRILLKTNRFRPRFTKPYIDKIRDRMPAYRAYGVGDESIANTNG